MSDLREFTPAGSFVAIRLGLGSRAFRSAFTYEFLANFRARLLKRADALRLDRFRFDDVVAELAFDEVADTAGGKVKGGFFKFFHHAAAGEESQISAFGRGARVL